MSMPNPDKFQPPPINATEFMPPANPKQYGQPTKIIECSKKINLCYKL